MTMTKSEILKQIDKLRHMVEAMADDAPVAKAVENTVNRGRREAIAKAKAFVEHHTKNFPYINIEIIRVPRERKVVVKLHGLVTKRRAVGVAQCHPDDTYNADIGAALALARAMYKLTNKPKYAQDAKDFAAAPQPDEMVIGSVVANMTGHKVKVFAVRPEKRTLSRRPEGVGQKFVAPERGFTYLDGTPGEQWQFIDLYSKIVDDTDAEYEGGAAR
jgi:hypothetical protein